ncbi:hypothetical protein R1sor_006589 [Riccia sorocarpa]|uniref:Protein kinase domain-containing protein n=1 Tax=Riccia sorocarpa TaxID=122646 RepID=A0ABD3HNG7_9MARC
MAEKRALDFVCVRVLEQNEDLSKFYTLGGPLGDGLFGETVLATPVSDPTQRFALKVQPKVNQFFYQAEPSIELLRLFKEVVFVNRILPKHPNIIEVKDVLISPDKVFIVQELCEGKMETFYPEADDASGRRAFGQLVEALRVCHEYGITHGDIKEDNILFLDREYTQLKLIDFGVADYNAERAVKRNNEFDHSKWFTSDELTQVAGVGPLQDIKALGKVLHTIICGQYVPLLQSGMIEELQTTYRPRTDRFSPAALHLLSLIGPVPYGPEEEHEFPTIDQICKHPWLTGAQFILPKPPLSLSEQIDLLQSDVRIVKSILKDWMVMPMKVLAEGESMKYQIVGMLERGGEQTRVFVAVSSDKKGRQRVMKVLHGSLVDTPPEQMQDCIPPTCIYLELLITLRILPRHENLVKIRDIYLNQRSVALVKELLHTNTLQQFFPLTTDASARRIFKQIANVVRHLHQHGVVHMDLHPNHIVFTDEEFSSCKIVNCSKALFVFPMVRQTHENFQPERQWEDDPVECEELLPRGSEFHPDAVNLLTRIGPDPYGPLQQDRKFTIDDICNHPWLLEA